MKLVAIPQVDIAALPLYLPSPTEFNTGGFLVPSPSGSFFTYSTIDLLVAGYTAAVRGEEVHDLVKYFDSFRDLTMVGEYFVYITYIKDQIMTRSIAYIKNIETDLSLMIRNAPLTFKWRKNEYKSHKEQESNTCKIRLRRQ